MVKMLLCTAMVVGAHAREEATMLQSRQLLPPDAEDKPVFAQVRKHTACYRLPHSADLTFGNAELVSNNLGGQGPLEGEEAIRLAGVRMGSREIDLVITSTTAYSAKDSSRNSKKSHGFANINVRAGTEVKLNFAFQDHETKDPVEIPDFYFTWADIDGSSKTKEVLVLPDITQSFVSENTEVDVGDHGGSVSVSSTSEGGGCDNPMNPMELKKVECAGREVFQQRRAVTVEYTARTNFEVTLKAEGQGNGGRNYLFFAGRSNLVGDCPRPTPDEYIVLPPGCEGYNTTGKVKEDCTNKDFFIFKKGVSDPFVEPSYSPTEYGSDDNWETVKVQDTDWNGACVAYIQGGSCHQFCKSQGKTCIKGMDDAHHQTAQLSAWLEGGGYGPTDCTLLPSGHERKSTRDNGCRQNWLSQVCACT